MLLRSSPSLQGEVNATAMASTHGWLQKSKMDELHGSSRMMGEAASWFFFHVNAGSGPPPEPQRPGPLK